MGGMVAMMAWIVKQCFSKTFHWAITRRSKVTALSMFNDAKKI
jgi:hypothetical protein